MMKAALEYYRENKVERPKQRITLGELNSSNALRLRMRTQKATASPEFTPGEQALLRLVNNGHVGTMIARYAPAVEE
jgi:hypothetical protein